MRTNESEYKRLEDLVQELQGENDELRADNESLVQSNRQLRQSIAVLLGEPVNSL